MSKTLFSHADNERSRQRVLVDKMNQKLAALSAQEPTSNAVVMSEVLLLWSELVAILALGPEPEVRECDHCGCIIMKEATICGSCWMPTSKSQPEKSN
jgi:hypothetical protein